MKFLPGFLFLFASWLMPMHIFPWVSWHGEMLAFLAILAMGWELVYLAYRKRFSGHIVIPSAAIPLVALSVIIAIQWGTGMIQFGGDWLVLTAYLWLCIASISLGYIAARDGFSPAIVLAGTLVAGVLCSSFIQFAQTFEVWESFEWIHRAQYSKRSGANLAQPNQFATLLLMGMVSVMYLFECRKLGSVLSAVLVIVFLAALAATESRAGVLGFSALIIWWFSKRKAIAAKIDSRVVVFCGLVFMLLFWLWPVFMAEFFLPGGGAPAATSTVAYNRWAIWPQLLQSVMLRPWTGWGFGQVATAHNAVVDAYSKSEPYTYSHNIFLDFAIGMGLPAAILLLALVGVWIWRRICATQQLASWYCFAVLIPVAAHSLVEFPFAYSYFLAPVMFAIGALEGQLVTKPWVRIGVNSLAVGLILSTLVFVWSIPEYLDIEEDFRVMRFESLRVGKTPDDYQRPKVNFFTQLDALLHGGRVVPRPQMSESEIELSRIVALHFPMIATQNKYALVLALNGNSAEAVRQLRVMRAQQGEKKYAKIKDAWQILATEQYPQLKQIELP